MPTLVRAAAASLLAAGAALLLVTGCPSLADIGVGPPPGSGEASPPDAGTDRDSGRDAGARETGEAAAPCTADVGEDPKNCGACGHDCLGGSCAGGVCLPVVVYAGDTPSAIVVDGPDLVVTLDRQVDPNAGYVIRCTASDCMATKTVLATGLSNPWFATLDGKTAIWVNGGNTNIDAGAAVAGSVMGCAASGCPDGGPIVFSAPVEDAGDAGVLSLSGLSFDSTYLYWAFYSSFGVTGGIERCAKADCEGTRASLASGGMYLPLSVAVAGPYVYWTDLALSEVLRCTRPSCGGEPQILANNQDTPSGLAVYNDTVYWTNNVNPGQVMSCPVAGCGAGPTVVASGQASPYAIAADDSGVYWTNIDTGEVMRCAPGGCKSPAVIAAAPAAFAIALDPVSVYFTSSTAAGSVQRVAK